MILATYGTPEELYHHGVKGQKWGVRRYQNADGSLTAKGEKRYASVQKSQRKKKLDTNWAKSIYSENAKMDRRDAYDAYNKSAMYKNSSARYEQLSKNEKNQKKSKKYKELSKQDLQKSKEYADKGKTYLQHEKTMNKKLEDLDKGVLQAGRDFIVTSEMSFLRGNQWNIIEKGNKNTTNMRYTSRGYGGYRRTREE